MNGSNKSDDKKISPSATYKPISEKEMEENAVTQGKSGSKFTKKESDGADEIMLPKQDSKVSPNSEISLKDVKLVMAEKNGDAKLDIVEPKDNFGGMTKEELMKYANDPFWVRLRWFLFITFWILWAAMLVGAIMIIYAAPKCDPPAPKTWWQVGPLAGLKQDIKPEDLSAINKNIKGLIITWTDDAYKPFDESHDKIKLMKQSIDVGTKVIIDLDPSTSDIWFETSEYKNSTFDDYYIWQTPKFIDNIPNPPTNWMLSNSSSWKFSPKRNQYYYAPFQYPHLNFRNILVVNQFSEVVKKFLEYGASGIRIRNAPFLLVDPKFEDENVLTNKVGAVVGEAGFVMPTKTMNLADLGKLLLNWKEIITNNTADGLLMVAEELNHMQSYQVDNKLVVDLPLITNVFSKPIVTDIVRRLNQTFKIDNVEWPLWGEQSSSLPSDVISIVTNLLPGTSLVEFNATLDPQLLKIRDSQSIMRGNCDMHAIGNDTVFAFIREIAGNPGVLVALNTGDQTVNLNIRRDIPSLHDLEEVTIQYYSKNYNEVDFKDINAKKDSTNIPLSPKSVLVLQYVPKKKQ
ncbi:4F2 cell-surface antigen heavy chain isoform X1 [Diorhabda carinulata]|uniref:4F2 cell-surface antigen heavy chain isoform X1 n=1 Tax=Diorhabda carinulata TaxID=1163345 RepID=UPI0025A2CD36|nr:4F2 cell-surface antigen heavy chain isoform X1 [Diorhabda carinulata]